MEGGDPRGSGQRQGGREGGRESEKREKKTNKEVGCSVFPKLPKEEGVVHTETRASREGERKRQTSMEKQAHKSLPSYQPPPSIFPLGSTKLPLSGRGEFAQTHRELSATSKRLWHSPNSALPAWPAGKKKKDGQKKGRDVSRQARRKGEEFRTVSLEAVRVHDRHQRRRRRENKRK